MLHIHKITIPDDHRDPHWQAHRNLGNLEAREAIGGSEWDTSAAEALEPVHHWQGKFIFQYWIAYACGEPVGTAFLGIHTQADPTAGNLTLYIIPDRRGEGIGQKLVKHLAVTVREAKLTRLRCSVLTPPPSGEQIVPTTGVGAVPADHDGVRFALRHQFTLEQTERHSRYDFRSPLIDPRKARAQAQHRAGHDYEVITWADATPDEFFPDLALLRQHLVSDAPSGGLVMAEDVWDVDRMREEEQHELATDHQWAAAARHRPSGRIVAISYLSRPHSKPEGFIEQKGTVVLPEHRGRRLGMLVKASNLIQVRDNIPDAKAIMTSNVEENRTMLDINEALGFRPFLVEATFQRLL